MVSREEKERRRALEKAELEKRVLAGDFTKEQSKRLEEIWDKEKRGISAQANPNSMQSKEKESPSSGNSKNNQSPETQSADNSSNDNNNSNNKNNNSNSSSPLQLPSFGNLGVSSRNRSFVDPLKAQKTLNVVAIIIIFLALAKYFLRVAVPLFNTLSSFLLFFLGVYAVLLYYQKEGATGKTWGAWVIVSAALIILFIFRGQPQLTLITMVTAGILVFIWVSKQQVGESAGVLAVLIIPALIFALDFLLPYASVNFGQWIPQYFLLFFYTIPWWLLFGLIVFQPESTTWNLVRVIAIIGFIIIGVVLPLSEDLGGYAAFLPGAEEYVKAQEKFTEVAEKFQPKTERRLVSQLACALQFTTIDQTICIKERQAESGYASICKQEGFVINSPEYEQCIIRERQKAASKELMAESIIDQKREPVKLEFRPVTYPSSNRRKAGELPQMEYPLSLIVENPTGEKITVGVSCKLKRGEEIIAGIITNKQPFFEVGENPLFATITCSPPKTDIYNNPIQGRYQFIFEAEAKHIKTTTTLKRVFIGEKDIKWKEEWFPKIMQAHFSGKSYLSEAPDDPARINFAFGMESITTSSKLNSLRDQFSRSLDFPFIEKSGDIPLSVTLENVGKGKITKVNGYTLTDFSGFGCDTAPCSDTKCIANTAVLDPLIGPWENEKLIYSRYLEKEATLALCRINKLPSELENPQSEEAVEYILRSFEAALDYDYSIRQETPEFDFIIDQPTVVAQTTSAPAESGTETS